MLISVSEVKGLEEQVSMSVSVGHGLARAEEIVSISVYEETFIGVFSLDLERTDIEEISL